MEKLLPAFDSKKFMWYHAQQFQQHTVQLAYPKEEEIFFKNVERDSRNPAPSNANDISAHVFCNVKVNDVGPLSLKARTAPHINEDSTVSKIKFD